MSLAGEPFYLCLAWMFLHIGFYYFFTEFDLAGIFLVFNSSYYKKIYFQVFSVIKKYFIRGYFSWVLFIRSFFLKEQPLFIVIITLIYPFCTLLISTDANYDAFIEMRILLFVGIYLLSTDLMGSLIATHFEKIPYLKEFYNDRNKNTLKGFYLSSGWSALIVGKTAMSSTGRAAMAAAFVSGGVFLYNGHLQRVHETAEAAHQRAHESAEAVHQRAHETASSTRQRAYADYTYNRDQYDRQWFKRGKRPVWSEENVNEKKTP